ncbi:FMN-linked oxidoreductase [Auricularia subglabra TFB-10046 SS5]|nr:FMN-linked oxidoreductase [Auricularia subglabra TFB-10046 SS5]
MSTPALFTPVRVGATALEHRVVLAPLTRYRADVDHVHTDLAVEYYAQRASTPGTLLISEATFIDARAGGYSNVPGIWNDAQIAAWRKITDVVHLKGSRIYCQLWALGRAAIRSQLPAEFDVVSSGDIQINATTTKPRALTLQDIDEYVELYVRAAKNAIAAGFDGVEVHSANGYLLDQFIQTPSNNRTDEYGGSIENRIRFPLRVVRAVRDAVGPDRTGIRLSPYERFQGMYMPPADLRPTFSALITELSTLGLAYLHLTEPRVSGQLASRIDDAPGLAESLDWALDIWRTQPIILCGGYTAESALQRAEESKAKGDEVLIAFGRRFISNPDLPERIRKGIPFTPYDRSTFYLRMSPRGYTDYAFETGDGARLVKATL